MSVVVSEARAAADAASTNSPKPAVPVVLEVSLGTDRDEAGRWFWTVEGWGGEDFWGPGEADLYFFTSRTGRGVWQWWNDGETSDSQLATSRQFDIGSCSPKDRLARIVEFHTGR